MSRQQFLAISNLIYEIIVSINTVDFFRSRERPGLRIRLFYPRIRFQLSIKKYGFRLRQFSNLVGPGSSALENTKKCGSEVKICKYHERKIRKEAQSYLRFLLGLEGRHQQVPLGVQAHLLQRLLLTGQLNISSWLNMSC